MIKSLISVLKGIGLALIFDLLPALKYFFAFLIAQIRACLGKKKQKTRKRPSYVTFQLIILLLRDPIPTIIVRT